MYSLFTLLIGAIISVMVLFNGELTQIYGTYIASVIIHIVGVLFAIILCIIRKENFKIPKTIPVWAYLGGVIGVLTTLSNNYAFNKISMTSLVALGLLGQSLTSIILDSFGLFGTKKIKLRFSSLIGFIPALIGILVMMDKSISGSFLAVLISIFAGVCVVLTRTANSRLSIETSPLIGSFINHIVGLPICVVILFIR